MNIRDDFHLRLVVLSLLNMTVGSGAAPRYRFDRCGIGLQTVQMHQIISGGGKQKLPGYSSTAVLPQLAHATHSFALLTVSPLAALPYPILWFVSSRSGCNTTPTLTADDPRGGSHRACVSMAQRAPSRRASLRRTRERTLEVLAQSAEIGVPNYTLKVFHRSGSVPWLFRCVITASCNAAFRV
jgi:hypothetical protein